MSGSSGTVYGWSRAQRELFMMVTATASDLRGQLEALAECVHYTAYDPGDVEAVRGALFAAHGYGKQTWHERAKELR